MNEKQLGLIVISPMIIATAVLLWRQGALGLFQVALVAVAVTGIASYLFFNF